MYNIPAAYKQFPYINSLPNDNTKNTPKSTSPNNITQFPCQNNNRVSIPENTLNTIPQNSTQLSMFVENSTDVNPIVYERGKVPHQKVLPIKTPDICAQVYKALLNSGRYGKRNAAIFALNLATGRRSSDILRFKISDVYDYTTNSIRTKISLKESKTGKMVIGLPLDKYTAQILESYIHSLRNRSPQAYLFPSQKKNPDGSQRPINVTSLNEILKANTETICSNLKDPDRTHFSSYVARKTFAYRLYEHHMKTNNGMLDNGIHVLDFLQSVFNHSSREITLRYIGAWEDASESTINPVAEEWGEIVYDVSESDLSTCDLLGD